MGSTPSSGCPRALLALPVTSSPLASVPFRSPRPQSPLSWAAPPDGLRNCPPALLLTEPLGIVHLSPNWLLLSGSVTPSRSETG